MMMEFELTRDCSDCPCLNIDYEQGAECNLKYKVNLEWTMKKDMIHCSENCELIAIEFEGGKFQPAEKVQTTSIHPKKWSEAESENIETRYIKEVQRLRRVAKAEIMQQAKSGNSNAVKSHRWSTKAQGCQTCSECGATRHDKQYQGYYFWSAGAGYDYPPECR